MVAKSHKEEVLKLAKDALETRANDFIALAEEITDLLGRETGQIGGMMVRGKLATLRPESTAVIVGDLHGDIGSLMHILTDSNFIEQVHHQNEEIFLIFLGDYGDRGLYSAEVYYVILKLKKRFPRNVILVRGNHEGPKDLLPSPHDLPYQFSQRFGTRGEACYSIIRKLFDQLYNAVFVENRYIMIHGGFPSTAQSLDDLAFAHMKHPKELFLEEMLWNDPEDDITGTHPSPRGAGKLFGRDITAAFLERLKINALIRSHEPDDEGFRLNHDGRVLTLFSNKGGPYLNEHGAYLKIDLSLKAKNAKELLLCVHQF